MGIQLRKLAYKIVNSSTLILPAWKAVLATLKINERLMPRDVTTRWNSTFVMLDFAITHRKALDLLAEDQTNGLREYEISGAEWQIAQQLHDALKVRQQVGPRSRLLVQRHTPQIFRDATLFFSRGTPNLATVIPAMDHLDQHLATASLNRNYVPAVRVALAIGKAKLNRYYNLTDSSEVYRITMGKYMHPSCSTILLIVFQFCILGISSSTSKTRSGNLPGSKLRETSFVPNMIARMRKPSTRRMET
jgi:hypothetical protein